MKNQNVIRIAKAITYLKCAECEGLTETVKCAGITNVSISFRYAVIVFTRTDSTRNDVPTSYVSYDTDTGAWHGHIEHPDADRTARQAVRYARRMMCAYGTC